VATSPNEDHHMFTQLYVISPHDVEIITRPRTSTPRRYKLPFSPFVMQTRSLRTMVLSQPQHLLVAKSE
jgi:hypothetical protein